VNIVYKTDYDVYGLGFIRHSIEGSYINSRNDLYDIDYEYDKLSNIKQINLHAKTWLWTNVTGEVLLVRSISTSKNNEEDISITYLSPCWSVELRMAKTPTDKAVYLIFNLANISSHLGVSL
jgi:LPS-assembly protein